MLRQPRRIGRADSGAVAVPDLTVVIPAFNEESRLTRSLPPLLESLSAIRAELILVDDGSSDDTVRVAGGLMGSGPDRFVLSLPKHAGKGAAVGAGVACARGTSIIFMDADMATDLAHVPEVLDALERDHIAIGSRAAPGAVTIGATGARRRMGWTFNKLARSMTGVQLTDFQCGFKGFRASVAKMLFGLSQVDGYAFDVEILMLASQIGYRIVEIPVRWQAVAEGHVRPARDAPLMGLDVVRARLRWTSRRTLETVEASCDDALEPEQVVTALRSRFAAFGPVVPWRHGALGLMPLVQPGAAAELAARLQGEFPNLEVHPSSIPASRLFGRSAAALRSALVAA